MLKAKQDGNRGHHTGSSKKGQCKITWCAVRQWRWCRVHIWWEHIHLAELWYLVPGIITQGICAPQFFVSLKSGSDWCCWLLILIQSLCWNSTWSPGWLPIDSNSISKQWEQQVQFLLVQQDARICEPISHFLESKQKMRFQHHVASIYSIDFTFLLVGSENHQAKLLPDGCSFPSYVIGVSIWWYECTRYLVVWVYVLYIPGLEREVID